MRLDYYQTDEEIRYQGASSAKARVENLAEFINGYRPEAEKRNRENKVKMKTVSGLVYCRSRLAVRVATRYLADGSAKIPPRICVNWVSIPCPFTRK